MDENEFWFLIFHDHLTFIITSLAPEEVELIESAQFIQAQLRGPQDLPGLIEQIRLLKQEILKRHLVGNVKIHLPPTFINHMLNELEEYQRVLAGNPTHVLDCHQLWLLDAAGHASAVACNLDDTEMLRKKQFKAFGKKFKKLYLKTLEFIGFTRGVGVAYPALEQLTTEASTEARIFTQVLRELEEQRLNKTALGTILPLMIDHMIREECYYLAKLGQSCQ